MDEKGMDEEKKTSGGASYSQWFWGAHPLTHSSVALCGRKIYPRWPSMLHQLNQGRRGKPALLLLPACSPRVCAVWRRGHNQANNARKSDSSRQQTRQQSVKMRIPRGKKSGAAVCDRPMALFAFSVLSCLVVRHSSWGPSPSRSLPGDQALHAVFPIRIMPPPLFFSWPFVLSISNTSSAQHAPSLASWHTGSTGARFFVLSLFIKNKCL